MSKQDQRTRVAESRRDFLKGSGTALASIPIAPHLLQNLSTEDLELERTRCPVLGITFEVIENVKSTDIDVVQPWPNLGWKGEISDASSEDRPLFVTDLQSSTLQSKDEVLLFSPSGIRRIPSDGTISFDYLPTTASQQGGRVQMAGVGGPEMRILADESLAGIEAGDASISVKPGKTATTTGKQKVMTRDGKQPFTVSITASYFGTREVVGHRDRLLFPNVPLVQELIRKIKKYKNRDKYAARFVFPIHRTTVNSLDGHDGYSINIQEGR